jgi:hypothetical protein
VRRFYVVTPIRALRALSERIIEHWETGYGSTYNATRKDALSLVTVEVDLDGTLIAVERETGRKPRVVVTSARPGRATIASIFPPCAASSKRNSNHTSSSSERVGALRRRSWPERTSASSP